MHAQSSGFSMCLYWPKPKAATVDPTLAVPTKKEEILETH